MLGRLVSLSFARHLHPFFPQMEPSLFVGLSVSLLGFFETILGLLQVSHKIGIAHGDQCDSDAKVPNKSKPQGLCQTAPAACAATFRTIGAARQAPSEPAAGLPVNLSSKKTPPDWQPAGSSWMRSGLRDRRCILAWKPASVNRRAQRCP